MRRTMGLVVGLALLATTASAGTLGERKDATRSFAAQNCRYTLIRDDWSWRERSEPPIIFSAENKTGTAVVLATSTIPLNTQLTADYAERLGATVFGRQTLFRRGGHFMVFQGQVCYQTETRLAAGNTMACRVFFVHGVSYALGVIGGKNPVENDRDFEAIMNGFAFADSPAAENKETSSWFADHAVYAGGGIFFLLILFLPRLMPGRTAPQGR